MAGGKQSKTSRASVRAGAGGKAGEISALGEVKYLIPLNNGKNCYVRSIANGQTPNLRTNSEAFVEQIRALADAGAGAKLRAELEALAAESPDHGWDATIKRLDEAEALGAPVA